MNEAGLFEEIEIRQVKQIADSDNLRINLIMDRSDSMSGVKLQNAKGAAKSFINEVRSKSYDCRFELVSFGSDVTLLQNSTSDYDLLIRIIDGIGTSGSTALYDAIGFSILRLNDVSGVKCVIAFTDGEENASRIYTESDLAEMSLRTGIPVYIIGIDVGSGSVVYRFIERTGGKYFDLSGENLDSALADIYSQIYESQRELYAISYFSNCEKSERLATVKIEAQNGYEGSALREYAPVTKTDRFTGGIGWDGDFILPDSASRLVTDSDLRGKTLAQLRVARNEIFARHGRKFVDPHLNKWFFSKGWYMQIPVKYEPDAFDRLPQPLGKIELSNIDTIIKYENALMVGKIFPDYSIHAYSEYDVYLRKEVLQRGLNEIYESKSVKFGDKSKFNEIELANVELIERILR